MVRGRLVPTEAERVKKLKRIGTVLRRTFPQIKGADKQSRIRGTRGKIVHKESQKPHPSKSTSVHWIKRKEPWASEAACLKADPNIFFPEKGGSTREAKRICSSCEVRQECLGFSLYKGAIRYMGRIERT